MDARVFQTAAGCDWILAMRGNWTDAEFEVIAGRPRHGDPHPTQPGWRYFGVDSHGMDLWRRPPRLNRLQFFGALCGAAIMAQVVIYELAERLAHH